MSIDFTLPPDVEETRRRVREFMDEVVRPAEEKVYANAPDGEPDRSDIVRMIIELRQKAHEWNVASHMPKEWGGLGLGITAMAFVSAGQPARLRAVHPQRPGARRGQPAHAAAPRQRRAEGSTSNRCSRGGCARASR
jgi:alkylation response protein AidB-like acyl-CoA dehydrogenase